MQAASSSLHPTETAKGTNKPAHDIATRSPPLRMEPAISRKNWRAEVVIKEPSHVLIRLTTELDHIIEYNGGGIESLKVFLDGNLVSSSWWSQDYHKFTIPDQSSTYDATLIIQPGFRHKITLVVAGHVLLDKVRAPNAVF